MELAPVPIERFGESGLYQCDGCDLQVWRPASSPGPSWYDESGHYLSKTIVDWLGWHHSFGIRSLPAETASLLDVGCADGRFVYAAARRGIDAVGIDFSPRLVRDGNARYGGDRLTCVTLREHVKETGRLYDVVTLFEVIEHVEDPLGLLRQAVGATRPGGLVIVSTPNRLGRPRPPRELDSPPHHLTRWTPGVLRSVAGRAGLEVMEVALCPPDVAIKAMILARLRLNLVTRLLRRRIAIAADVPAQTGRGNADLWLLIRAKDLAAEAIAKLVSPLVGRWFPGPAMVMIARRPIAHGRGTQSGDGS